MTKYERAYLMAYKERKAGWKETAIALLAADIGEATGEPVEVSGPFGLRAAVHIHTPHKSICITPVFPEDKGFSLYYDTDETLSEFAPGTIGAMNGFNIVSKPLPESINKILEVMQDRYTGEEN